MNREPAGYQFDRVCDRVWLRITWISTANDPARASSEPGITEHSEPGHGSDRHHGGSSTLLGLLVTSAESSYDSVNSELTHMSADVIMLDRELTHYGPETNLTVIISLLLAALAVSETIFLMFELTRPFEGLIQISGAPLRKAFVHLDR